MAQEAYLAPPPHGVNHEDSRRCFDRADGQDVLLNLTAVEEVGAKYARQQTGRKGRGQSASLDRQHHITVTGLGELATLIPQKDILRFGMR
jgi:hypothetical protein